MIIANKPVEPLGLVAAPPPQCLGQQPDQDGREAGGGEERGDGEGPGGVGRAAAPARGAVPGRVGGPVRHHEVDRGEDDGGHQGGGHEPPGQLPEGARGDARHGRDVPGEPPVAVHIHHGHQLREGNESES